MLKINVWFMHIILFFLTSRLQIYSSVSNDKWVSGYFPVTASCRLIALDECAFSSNVLITDSMAHIKELCFATQETESMNPTTHAI